VEQGSPDFTSFLGRLQALIGSEVTVEVGIDNRFFGVQFNAELVDPSISTDRNS
jgi:hypothetical protein